MSSSPIAHQWLQRGEAVECAEWVLPGHPDKLCDAVADSIVGAVSRLSARGQCGIEAACVFDKLVVTGRIAIEDAEAARVVEANLDAWVRDAWRAAGYGKDAAGHAWGPRPEDLHITRHLRLAPFDEGEAPLRHLSDDQAICVGYANAIEGCAGLPPAHWLARRIARTLHDLRAAKGAGQVGPDGKVLVRVARSGHSWRPLAVSISLNHHEGSDWMFLDGFAREAVETACAGLPTPHVTLNGAGMFVCGGPNGDNGQTGKKLVMDAYGPTVPIGGGAWSGKDLWKVDRRGGLLARALARWLVGKGGFGEAQVTLEYYPGSDAPDRAYAIADGERLELAVGGLTGDVVTPLLQRACGVEAPTPHGSGLCTTLGKANMLARAHIEGASRALADMARWGHHQRLEGALDALLDADPPWSPFACVLTSARYLQEPAVPLADAPQQP